MFINQHSAERHSKLYFKSLSVFLNQLNLERVKIRILGMAKLLKYTACYFMLYNITLF